MNIYSATVSDRIHYCDLGLFNYQVNFTQNYIWLHCEQEGIDEFDKHLAAISRFSDLKSFKYSLSNIACFTVTEFRSMIKQLIFVIDSLIVLKHKSTLESNLTKWYNSKLVYLFIL